MTDPTVDELDGDLEVVEVTVGDREANVATLTIDRPEARNALNEQVRTELNRAMAALDADEDVRVIVLTGSDEAKAFVAGADVTDLLGRGSLEQRKKSERPRVYETIADAETVVIGRINGHALGGGCELAQACDMRIADEGAKLGQPEVTLGLMPGGGATQRLPRLIGRGQAMRLILSGELIDADEAARIGLVDEVHPPAELDDRIYELAGRIARNAPLAIDFARRAIRAADEMPLTAGIDYEAELFAVLFDSVDKDEGIEAFLEDREADWVGR